MEAISCLAATMRASSGRLITLGTISAASTPRMTITTMSSMRVKPSECFSLKRKGKAGVILCGLSQVNWTAPSLPNLEGVLGVRVTRLINSCDGIAKILCYREDGFYESLVGIVRFTKCQNVEMWHPRNCAKKVGEGFLPPRGLLSACPSG